MSIYLNEKILKGAYIFKCTQIYLQVGAAYNVNALIWQHL